MRRVFTATLMVLIIASLLVSCNMEPGTEDGLALLSFCASEDSLSAKGLTRTSPALEVDQLYWSYTAVKADTSTLTTGQTTSQKHFSTQGLTESVGSFSYGKWTFTLYGYLNQDRSKLVYKGEVAVTIKEKTAKISVPVYTQSSETGFLEIPAKGAITITRSDGTTVEDYSQYLEQVYIKAADENSSYEPTTYYIENTTAVTNLELASGSYSVTVSYLLASDLSVVYAQETLYVTVSDFLTTKLGGTLSENLSDGSISAGGGSESSTSAVAIKVGDFFNMGTYISDSSVQEKYAGKSITWKVLEVDETNNRALVISENILENRQFDSDSRAYSGSDIQTYLNGDFITTYGLSSIKDKICNVDVTSTIEETSVGSGSDKVFLLSQTEVEKYFTTQSARIAKYDGKNLSWWLRSPCLEFGDSDVVYVYDDGGFLHMIYGDRKGIRPAFWLQL